MKKHFLKSFALLAMLFSAITLSAQSGVDWSTYEFLGDGAGGGAYSNKYKVAKVDGMNVVNIQTGGVWGSSVGIFVNFPAAGITCDLPEYSINGAGMLMHLSSFTAQETKVNVTYATGSCTFWVYYADGTTGGSSEPETPDTEVPTLTSVELFGAAQNFVLLTPTASDNKKVTAYLITPNGGAETEATLDDAGKIKISGLTMNTSYTYSVKAKDAAGNFSAAKEITFSTLDNVFCEEEVLPTNFFTKNQKLTLTAKKITTTKTLIELTSTTSTLTGVQNYNITNSGGGAISAQTDWTVANNTLSKTITWATYPTNPITMFVTALRTPGAGESNMIEFNYTIDVSNTCGGVIEENPTITTTPAYSACTGDNYSYVYTNDNAGNVHLSVTFNQAIEGVNGPQFYTDNNVALAATTPDNRNFYVSVSDKNDGDIVKLRAHIPRAGGLTTTPLLTHTVGQVTNDIITTEYNNYTDATMTKNGASVAFTWETATNGDIVVTMSNGAGATSCSFRSGGFEGGIETFVVSTDNFATTLPASDYFTYTPVSSGNEARFVKKADLPKGAKIKFVGEGGGKALCWKVNDTDQYEWVKFIYTYGSVSNKLAAPTNVAVTDAGAITFDAVAGADSYEVYVYQGEELKHSQDITSGGTIEYVDYVANVYTVNVIAKATCKVNSEKSASVTWNKPASPLPASNYCEKQADRITVNNGSCNPLFTWTTDNAGNVVITISASEGNAGETKFRIENGTKQGMNGIFKLNGSEADFNTYFNKGITDEYTYTLTLNNAANKPTLGSVISFSGQIEAESSIHNDDWSDYEFDGYLYGTKCDGPKRVTVSVNDAAMGTAKVNGQDEVYVDPDTEVTFTATPNEGYVFANWTKGDEVVSTSATYTTTITSALSLVANFDYIRTIYCQQEVLTNAGRKVYLTVGQAATTGKYQIKIEGTSSLTITAINNANTAMNNIKFTGTDADGNPINYDGNDVPLTKYNGGWTYSNEGYGVITSAEIEPSTGKTWKDMWMWRPDLYFKTSLSNEEQINDVLAQQNHFDWSNKCEEDADKPVMGTAELVSQSHNTATIAVTATDNRMVHSYHVVSTTPAHDQTIEPIDGNITVTNLTANTDYTFTITAIDLAGNESDNYATVSVKTNAYIAEPSSLPTAPTWPANQVQAVYSATYVADCGFGEWGSGTQYSQDTYGKKYVTLAGGYFGLVDFALNCSKMERLHLDVWCANNTSLGIVPIYKTGQAAHEDKRVTKNIIGGQWNSIDIPLTEFEGVPDWSNIREIKIDNVPNQTLWFNNIYFYTTQAPTDTDAPTDITASATPSFETAVISCSATDESGSVNFRVMLGTELKGTGSAASGEIANITVTNLQPNREFTMQVYASDVYGNEATTPVEVTFKTLAYPEPAPTPIWKAENVKSIYSESYAPAFTSLNSYNEGWWNAPQMLDAAIAPDNHALYYYGFTDGMIGWQFAAFDATGYTTFTMDIYPMNDGTIDFGPLNEDPANDYAITGIPVKGGQWNTITVDLRDKDLAKIFQVKMINYYSLGAFFIDNVYLYKMVIDENTDLTKLVNGLECDVTLKRNFAMGDDGWNTISLPFALNAQQIEDIFGDGTKVTKLTSSNLISSTEIDLQFVEVTAMEAATPYLIHPTNNVDAGVLVEDVIINVTPNIIEADITQMIPVLKTENFTGQDNAFFLGPDDNLYNKSADGKIKGLRAYFKFSTLTPAQLNNLRARVVFNENEATGLDNLTTDDAPTKRIENGQLIIIRNGEKYNIQGQKL